MNSLTSQIYEIVMNLLVNKKANVLDVDSLIDKMYAQFKEFYDEDEFDKEALLRQIVFDYGVFDGESKILEDNRDHIEWLANERSEIQWTFWRRYKKYLEVIEKLPPAVVKEIDSTTDEILKRLESPRRSGSWDRRGMVVGNVQSGKTSNYIGLISKAVDAQYKIIIVLAGLNNDLRSQTQRRIDKGFLGRDTRKNDSYDQTSSKIGAGLLPGFGEPAFHAVTSADAGGDFKTSVHKHVTIAPGGDPIIAVVKKNVTPLSNLLNWFTSVNDSGRITGIPLLLIDDEADNASIDTKSVKRIGRTVVDPDAAEQDPTKINGLIRQILNCFTQSAYVGYTATPFANIFIYPTDPDMEGEEFGEDLYPRSFIVNLQPPSNYIGPERVFGLYKDKTANIKEVKPLPLVRLADDYKSIFPEKHKKDLIVTGLPDSLYQAIYAFILSKAARTVRRQGNKHHSMLIHVTRFVDVQTQIVNLVDGVINSIVEQLEFRTGPQYEKLINELHDMWNEDFIPTTSSVKKSIKDNGVFAIDWDEIEPLLYSCASKIEVKAVNGKAADGGIDYDSYPNGCTVIAVGGDKLSRGLTLEGLTISYYARLSKMYDTLLQMGRWFGYRNGYVDLCRLYTSDQLKSWYTHIAVANEELRRELDDMADMGSTPEKYGLKVRTHPDGMIITALNKMRNSETRLVTYAGKLVQITRYYRNDNRNSQNIQYAQKWLSGLGIPLEPSQQTRNNYLWKHIDAERIIDFIQNISIHPDGINATPKVVSRYIMNQVEEGELTDWTVALISVKSGEKYKIADYEIGLSWRTDNNAKDDGDDHTIFLISNNLITESDQSVDLSSEEYAKAKEQTIKKWKPNARSKTPPNEPSPVEVRKFRKKTNGLLMIYIFRSGLTDEDNIKCVYDDIYLGYAISFPDSDSSRPVEYKVDEVYLRNNKDDE